MLVVLSENVLSSNTVSQCEGAFFNNLGDSWADFGTD